MSTAEHNSYFKTLITATTSSNIQNTCGSDSLTPVTFDSCNSEILQETTLAEGVPKMSVAESAASAGIRDSKKTSIRSAAVDSSPSVCFLGHPPESESCVLGAISEVVGMQQVMSQRLMICFCWNGQL